MMLLFLLVILSWHKMLGNYWQCHCSHAESLIRSHLQFSMTLRDASLLTILVCLQAIAFIQGQRDDDLWEHLITLALEDAAMIGEHLNSATFLICTSSLAA